MIYDCDIILLSSRVILDEDKVLPIVPTQLFHRKDAQTTQETFKLL